MDGNRLFHDIREHIEEVISEKEPLGPALWSSLIGMHPADIADLFSNFIDRDSAVRCFTKLPETIRLAVFPELSYPTQTYVLAQLSDQEQISALRALSVDDLTDLFDHFSDEELKKYLLLLNKGVQGKVISLLKFDPESAGGIMHIDVLTLQEDFTVEKSISLLQRLRPRKDIHQRIFVTNGEHRLVGYINLEDLVLQKPKNRVTEFMQKNELVITVDEDQETVAKQMVHYGLMTAPVIGKDQQFLGVISGETLVDVIVEEAGEDIQKMAALTPMKYSYFETSFFRLLWERSYVLVVLLMAESFSSNILSSFERSLNEFLLIFIPMLISAGGNTSSQTSAMVIQGMATGDISKNNVHRFIRREFIMALFLSVILGCTAFSRVWFTGGTIVESFAIGFSLSSIVMLATMLGSCLPFILQLFRIDPAFSAGPFLATIMDVLGIFIFCHVTKLFLF